ncbi:oligosaccharide flippase family protein [Vibrio cholerae]|nr:oligosaccharide flippase family protein [Vibrio cholerae]
MSQKKVYKNIGYLLLVQFANYIAPLLVLPYLTRVLGVEAFGTIVMAMSMCSIAMILTDFGFNLSGTFWVSKNRHDKIEIAKYVSAVTFAKIFLCFLSVFFVWLYDFYAENNFGIHITTAISVVVISQGFQLTWFFQGIEKMRNVTASLVTAKLLYMFLVLAFVKDQNDAVVVLYCLAFSNIVSIFIGFILLYLEEIKISIPRARNVKSAVKNSISFFLSRAAVGVYTSASTFIVGAFCNVHQAAIYSSAEKLYQAGQGLVSPVSQALFPYLATTRDGKSLYRFVSILLIPMVLGCLICGLYAEEIVTLIYGAEFLGAGQVLLIFMATSVITFISINFGYPAYSVINKLSFVNYTVMVAGVFQLLSLSYLYFAHSISPITIAWSVFLVEVAVMIMRVGFFIVCIRKQH